MNSPTTFLEDFQQSSNIRIVTIKCKVGSGQHLKETVNKPLNWLSIIDCLRID